MRSSANYDWRLKIDGMIRIGELTEMVLLPAEIIKSKRNGKTLSQEEIELFIGGYVSGQVPDYQMSALLMAIFFNGMTSEETLSLTKTMLNSGERVQFDKNFFCVDKHSTGGVGDKTSLILAPIVAAAGVPVPMISGRGLGHTGGTLDKLESIPGFKTQIDLSTFKKNVEEHLLCFIGQTERICPADKKIYALRDVTATVESYPLICASIMSKKIAEGISGLVLDIKCGSGAFMKTMAQAEELADRLMKIAKGYGIKVASLITTMDRPLGRFAGNALEVKECLEILSGKSFFGPAGQDLYQETRDLSLSLAAHMIFMSGKTSTFEKSLKLAEQVLNSGEALKKFQKIVELQGGKLDQLPNPAFTFEVRSTGSGCIESLNVEKIGLAAVKIGAGRAKVTDLIEPTAGIEFLKTTGDSVNKGDIIFKVFGDQPQKLKNIETDLLDSLSLTNHAPKKQPLILKTLF